MDTTLSQPKSKSRKLLLEQDVGCGGEDIISKLPDSILLYILSFLPIKDVLRTSVWSKRWKYLWTCMSVIDFDEFMYDISSSMRSSFLDSVSRALALHESSSLRRFQIHLNTCASESRVNSWVSAAINHNVKELELGVQSKDQVVLPDSLFTSKSLKMLTLSMSCVLKVPRVVSFSSLKALGLNATFPDEQSTERFFSGFPVLRVLYLMDCSWKNTKSITISIPSLRELALHFKRGYQQHSADCLIKIYAKNLRRFLCTSLLTVGFVLCNLSSLVYAHIDVATMKLRSMQNKFLGRALYLLLGVRNVKNLSLSNDTLELLSCVQNVEAYLPPFDNLTRLKVNLGKSDYTSEMLMHFLKKTPCLEVLEIPEGFHPSQHWVYETVPQCLRFYLMGFRISNFDGTESEVRLLKYIIENGKMLELVQMSCSDKLAVDIEKQKEIFRQIDEEAIPVGVKNCVVEFCN